MTGMSLLARLSVSMRLFIAVMAVAAAAVIAAGLGSHRSFTNGFLGYLNQLAVDRMEEALPRLDEAWREHGSWDFIREHPRQWIRLMLRDQGGGMANEAPPPQSDLTGAFLRVTLLDAERRFVIGYHGNDEGESARIERPITIDGQTVGWLTLMPFQNVAEMGAERFAQEQLAAHRLIVLVVIVLAALIAWWVSRAVLRPIRQVARATHELAGGDYTRRVPEFGRDEVGQLARDFNHLAATLERNEAMRREFMADIAHELRTPLGVLNGELEAIEDGVRPLDQAAVSSLQAEVALLSKLVNDVYELALTDMAAMSYRKELLDARDCVQRATALMAPRLAQAGLQLECELPAAPLRVFADPGRLQQLLVNLLENSARYTQAGGTVRVRLATQGGLGRARALLLCCEDSAPGVPAELLPRLFDRFYRVEGSRNRATGGAGLGLAICRNIVQAHEGEIAATASPLGGLLVTVRLPLAAEVA